MTGELNSHLNTTKTNAKHANVHHYNFEKTKILKTAECSFHNLDLPQYSCLKKRCISYPHTIGSHWCWPYKMYSQNTGDTAYQLELQLHNKSHQGKEKYQLVIKNEDEFRGLQVSFCLI